MNYKSKKFRRQVAHFKTAAGLLYSVLVREHTATETTVFHLKKQAKDMAYLRLFEDAISAPVERLFHRKFLLAYNGEGVLPRTYVVFK